MKRPVLYPDTVAVAKYADIVNDTIYSLDTLITNGYSDIKLGEEMAQLTMSEETFEPTEFTQSGFLKIDSIRVSHQAQVTLTQSSLSHEALALSRGLHPDDVDATYNVNYSGTAGTTDGTAKAALKPASLNNEWMTLLLKCKLRDPADGDAYIFVPKAVIKPPEQQYDLIINGQIKPATTFECLAIDDDSDLTKFQAMFSGVAKNEVIYIFNGKVT